MRRRAFLKAAAGAASATLLGAFAYSRDAHAFGEMPPGAAEQLLPTELQAENILEIFLFGGVSQYESFYCVEEFGRSTTAPSQWHLSLQDGSLDEALASCGFSGGELLQPFAEDGAGRVVNFGPFVAPFRDRTDLLDRTRVIVNSHDLLPHELAVPMAITGRVPARVEAAGLGTHIQRYFQERDGTSGRVPSSYVMLTPSEVQNELVGHALAAGRHPGTARPLPLRFDQSTRATELFLRKRVGSTRQQHDALVRTYGDQMRGSLNWNGQQLTSSSLNDYEFARTLVEGAPDLTTLLAEQYFQTMPGASCGSSAVLNSPAMGLRLAAHLLNDGERRAKYVCVVDGGLVVTQGAGGYDSHSQNCVNQATNLLNLFRTLADMTNAPGEKDPSKIDLDRTLVIINTEFGRTPTAEGERGRGHWPFGYPTIYLGGPVRSRGVFGNIGPDATAESFSTPAQGRIAALLALGIWPFAPESFNIGDIEAGSVEIDGARKVIKEHFGYESA